MTSGKGRNSHVARLLQQVLAEVEPVALAYSLDASPQQLEAYRTGAERMSPDQQLSFSSFVLARFPQFARMAHRVAAQAHAESDYQAKTTQTHSNTPPSRYSK
jgi:hypothetical protein